jgi:hypothetical protein
MIDLVAGGVLNAPSAGEREQRRRLTVAPRRRDTRGVDADDRLRLDYDQTTQLMRALMDVRFKLLAFIPTIAGATVALFGKPRPAVELLAVGLLGLIATLGIFVYELRNTQIFDALLVRAVELERLLGLRSFFGGGRGGLFGERPGHTVRLLGLLPVGQHRGLALVYGAAISGWSYLVAWGGLKALEVHDARKLGGVLGALAGLVVLAEVERIDRRPDRAPQPRREPGAAGTS